MTFGKSSHDTVIDLDDAEQFRGPSMMSRDVKGLVDFTWNVFDFDMECFCEDSLAGGPGANRWSRECEHYVCAQLNHWPLSDFFFILQV